MIINIDIDGVLTQNVEIFFDYVQDYYDVAVNKEIRDFNAYIEEVDMHLADIVGDMYDRNPDYITNSEPFPGAPSAVRSIYDDNYVNIITHRPQMVQDSTEKWFEEHGIPYDNLIMGEDIDKSTVDGDVMIDDNPSVASTFESSETDFYLFPRTYNREVAELHHVRNLSDITSVGENRIIKERLQWEILLELLDN